MEEEQISFPPIYCINLPTSTARRQRMEQRFKFHNLQDIVTFVDAIPSGSAVVDYYIQGLTCPEGRPLWKWRGEIACYAAHLKAVRQFVKDGADYGLICEDDIMLHNNFLERYFKFITEEFVEGTPLVTMSYMIEQWKHFSPAGRKPDSGNVYTIDPVYTWGAQLYLISRKYAQEVLRTYDMPFRDVPYPLQTSEIIIRNSKGHIVFPPLAIEEGIDSDRDPPSLPYHHKHFGSWGYSNYNAAEAEHISPLANYKK